MRSLLATSLVLALALSGCSSDSIAEAKDASAEAKDASAEAKDASAEAKDASAVDATTDVADAGLTTCGYPINGGCDAALVCGLHVEPGNCAGALLCACDGTNTTACAAPGYSRKPVPVGSHLPCGSADAASE